MPLADGSISLTLEPSGEIRIKARTIPRHGGRGVGALQRGYSGAGCAGLVYSRKVRDSDAKRGGFGRLARPTSFTSAGRRMIKNAVGALKTEYGRQIVFLTLTLPGSTPQAREALAAWSAKTIELVTHWIRDKAPESKWCYVWEWQKSGALHLHAAIGTKDVLALRTLERGFKDYVHTMFETLSDLSGVDMFAREDGGSWRGFPEVLRSRIEPIRKCVKRYMAKYLTKGAGAALGHFPARWWGLADTLRAQVGNLRRCIRRATSNWGEVSVSMFLAERNIETSGYTLFAFSCPYSPSSRTLIVYPPEDELDNAYDMLALALFHGFNEG